MGGRIVDLLNSPHRAAEALLPWLLNGTLGPAERRRLQDHLQQCAACSAELERQGRLATLYREAAPAGTDFDCDAAWARLSARLDSETVRVSVRRRARSLFFWPAVAALQACAIAALVWIVWVASPDDATKPAAAYRGLAASTPASGDAVVIFAADATEADVRHALQQVRARIVDGPTAAGAYVVRFEQGDTGEALAVLRSERGVFRVEPLATVGSQPPSLPRQ